MKAKNIKFSSENSGARYRYVLKIENDGRSKVEIVIEALELYFASKKQHNDSNNDKSANNNDSQNDSTSFKDGNAS
jgi:hypothetical protein